jgi:two-component system OmpR family sensor kinase
VKLRLKILIAMILLVVAGLAVSGVVTYTALRNSLLQRVDQELADARSPVGHQLKDPGGPFQFGGGPPGSTSLLPPGTYAEMVDGSGRLLADPVVISYGGASVPAPVLPHSLPRSGRSLFRPDIFTTGSTDGSLRYRVVVQSAASVDPDLGSGILVVGVPLTDVEQTLRQLVWVEGLVALSVVIGLGLVSWWLVRRGLRPLEEMGDTAGAIAAGDLSRRVPQEDARTEVGQLGIALNAMLAQIEDAFAERKASEERLRRFLADASHELRTPLTSIRGYAELFRRGASERQEDLAKSMRRIEDESARMGILVDDLLLLARLDEKRALEMEGFDLSALASDAVQDARAADPERTVALDAPGPVPVVADEARMRQVAANLLSNALFHTPPATPVTVRVAMEGADAVLEVADRGPGLSPEWARRAFEPFFRSDPSRDRSTGGAGLGLSIVSAIAQAHGGSVALEPTPEGGATFRVAIPASGPARAGGARASAPATGDPQAGARDRSARASSIAAEATGDAIQGGRR